MCVIFGVDGPARPTEEEIDQAYDAMPHGGGAAWRIPRPDGVDGDEPVHVKWHKGLTREEMQQYNRELPFPYILHFRKITIGSGVNAECHPFPVLDDVPIWLCGTTSGRVLFHNGTWSGWDTKILDMAIKGGWKSDATGPWTDSRAIAFAAARMGEFILEFINETVCVFGPDSIHYFQGREHKWKFYDQRFIVSNEKWLPDNKGNSYHTTAPASMGGGHKTQVYTGPQPHGASGGGSTGDPFPVTEEEEKWLALPLLGLIQMRTERKLGKAQFKRLKKVWEFREAQRKLHLLLPAN